MRRKEDPRDGEHELDYAEGDALNCRVEFRRAPRRPKPNLPPAADRLPFRASSIGLTPKTCILLGCARVSTADQNLALQRDILTEAGRPKLLTEHVSGEGDALVVWKLDRLAAIRPAFEAALTGNFVIYPGRASDLSSGQE